MKTLLALIVAIAGFGATAAWSAEPAPREPTTRAAPAKPAAPAKSTTPRPARETRTPVVPAFDARLLDGPAVLCACTRSRVQA